jgi:Fe-S-cluster-containing dehydrogenase component
MRRRQFLSIMGAGAASLSTSAFASTPENELPDGFGMLVDTTECIGCRKCEGACARSNELTDRPSDSYEDQGVFQESRRMTPDAYTVVNRYPSPVPAEKPTFVKVQCMHCLKPACASARIARALEWQEKGAVTYNASRCMGCRYCMVACPFQVPTYEYNNAFAPRVRKCTFCFERVAKEGKMPACAEVCPPMCLTFAKRSELITLAREKIKQQPERYFNHIYGETEVGGTGWLYVTPRPASTLGFLELDDRPIPKLTETIQHSVFKHGIPPLLLAGFLAAAMKTFGTAEHPAPDDKGTPL